MKKISIWFGIPVCILILVGIGFFTYSAINPSREAIIRDIMTVLYTSPNPKVLDGLANQKEYSEIALDLYGKYLTDELIDELFDEFKSFNFTAKYLCLTNQFCDELGYEVKIDKIIISHTYLNKENEYHIKVNILYGKKGTLKKATLDNHRTEEVTIYFDKSGETNKIETMWADFTVESELYKIHRDLQESKESKDN